MKWITFLLFLGFAGSVSAQTAPNPWDRCTTVQVFGGVTAASPNTGGTFGTAIGWELTHRAEIEGVAAWVAERHGSDAFAADLKLLVNLTPPATVVPYLGGGMGLYRGSFRPAQSDIPGFYRRRMNGALPIGTVSYTDPTAVIAAGVNLYFARHFSLRPEANVRLAFDSGDTYRVGTVAFSVVYHVEEHASK